MEIDLRLGDCIEILKTLEGNSVDSIITDPPYHLTSITKRFGKEGSAPAQYGTDGAFARASKGFMGKEWDGGDIAFRTDVWKECLRVLKPGGHLLSFGGSRTYHRMAVAIEDAGFEVRDQIMWIYGSGFPKSHNIGKAIDKIQGNEREVVGDNPNHRKLQETNTMVGEPHSGDGIITKGNSEWEGWGTALKPAHEPICMARKPLSEKSIAENVLKHGTGGINIDDCRIGNEVRNNGSSLRDIRSGSLDAQISSKRERLEREDSIVEGRFPANIMFECICDEVIPDEKGEVKRSNNGTSNYYPEQNTLNKGVETKHYTDKGDIHTNPNCPCRLLDEQSGVSKGTEKKSKFVNYGNGEYGKKDGRKTQPTPKEIEGTWYGDKGGASRFFYCPKVSKKERNAGLEDMENRPSQLNSGGIGRKTSVEKRLETNGENAPTTKNIHPTVKPIALMEYLIKLVTPKGAVVMDCFMGSGSTGIAAKNLGMSFIGIEKEEEYFEIAKQRINGN